MQHGQMLTEQMLLSGGWVGGVSENGNKAISASIEVEVEVEMSWGWAWQFPKSLVELFVGLSCHHSIGFRGRSVVDAVGEASEDRGGLGGDQSEAWEDGQADPYDKVDTLHFR